MRLSVSRHRTAAQWMRSHRKSTLAMALLAAFALLNLWAFRHAWAMTHFSKGGASTLRPEQLSAVGRATVLLGGVNLPRPENSRTPAAMDLQFQTDHIRTVDGVELEVWQVAHPEPRAVVVLFHGYASSKAALLNEARELHDLRCSTLLVDFRGSGGSTGETTTLGVYEAEDVAAACRHARDLNPELPVVLFGRSMGSVAILRAIAKGGVRPDGAILECPFDRMLGTVEHRFHAMGLPAFPSAQLLVFWGGVQHGMNGFAHNPVEYAAQVECPVLLMHGAQDRRVNVREAKAIYGALAGRKHLEVFPDVGHEACCRTRPDLWAQLVEEFLDRLGL